MPEGPAAPPVQPVQGEHPACSALRAPVRRYVAEESRLGATGPLTNQNKYADYFEDVGLQSADDQPDVRHREAVVVDVHEGPLVDFAISDVRVGTRLMPQISVWKRKENLEEE